MKFPTITEIAKEVAEKALDEYVYEGKTIRQWVEILKDYDDKQSTLQDIVERLEERKNRPPELEYRHLNFEEAIEIVKEVGGMNV